MTSDLNVLDNITVVMDHTTHPGNIGSAARAMKTMGLMNLGLVAPKLFPDPQATAMACHADDVLENAVVVDDIDALLADCTWVIGASARSRTLQWPTVDPRVAAQQVLHEAKKGKVAVLFGTERTGLANDVLQKCHQHVVVPTNPDYSSLNVSAAVQLLCYELRMAALAGESTPNEWESKEPYPTKREMDLFYDALQKVMIDVGFYDPKIPKQLWPRVVRFFQRARPDKVELGVFRGVLAMIEQKVQRNKK